MSISKAVSHQTSQKSSILKRAKKQPDTIFSGVGMTMALITEAMPSFFGGVWAHIPFLGLGLIVGVFSLGRNWGRIWGWASEVMTAFDVTVQNTTRLEGRESFHEVHADIFLKEKFKKPKLVISLYKVEHLVGQPCRYVKFASINKKVPSDFNSGDKFSTRVLWYSDDNPNESDPSCLLRGANKNMGYQCRIMITITSANKSEYKKHFHVFLPSGQNTNFLPYIEGLECAIDADQVEAPPYHRIAEVDETISPQSVVSLPTFEELPELP